MIIPQFRRNTIMGHYDTQIEQDNEQKRKLRRVLLVNRMATAMEGIEINDLEKLVIAAENWDSVVSVIDMMRAISKN